MPFTNGSVRSLAPVPLGPSTEAPAAGEAVAVDDIAVIRRAQRDVVPGRDLRRSVAAGDAAVGGAKSER